MSQFKVALFTGNYNHIRDGAALSLNRWVGFLLENGVDVLVFGPTIEKPQIEHTGTFVPVPSIKAPGRPEYRLSVRFSAATRKKLEAFNPDLVHIATPDLLGYKAIKWAIRNKKPVVSSYHTHFPSYLKYYKLAFIEPLGWKYLKWFYNKCRQIYVPTPAMAEELKLKGLNGDLRIWSRGVNIQLFNPERRDESWRQTCGFAPEDIVVTFISRLVWEKNVRMYAEVLKRLISNHSNVKALVVGEGPAGPGMKQILPEAVYTGFMQGEDLATAYASSDIFFFPSDTEAFGNVTLEAMASGLPCVVADATGSRSLVTREENGFLAPVNDKNAFYNFLETLIQDAGLRAKMASRSLVRSKEYTWDKINHGLLSCYKEILEG